MGFNIAGLVIADNFEKNISKLEDDLNWDIEVIEEITFEEASSNWTPEGECRLYFSDKATMIFFPHEWVAERYTSSKASSLCYAYSAIAMTFYISYSDRVKNYDRFLITSEGEIKLAEGQKIPYEEEGLSSDAIIFKLFDDLLDENFHEIEMTAKAFRCKKLNRGTSRLRKPKSQPRENPRPVTVKADPQPAKRKETPSKKMKRKEGQNRKSNPPKKWWEFWK